MKKEKYRSRNGRLRIEKVRRAEKTRRGKGRRERKRIVREVEGRNKERPRRKD